MPVPLATWFLSAGTFPTNRVCEFFLVSAGQSSRPRTHRSAPARTQVSALVTVPDASGEVSMLRTFLLLTVIVCLMGMAAAQAAAEEILPAGTLLQCTLDEP